MDEPRGRKVDAIEWLTRDHQVIRNLLARHERLLGRFGIEEEKAEIVSQICWAWCVHLQVEEEIFYTQARAVLPHDALIEHALNDHGGTRELMALLGRQLPGDANRDATVAVLRAYVIPHMDEEEQLIFPRLRLAGLDGVAVGRRMASYRAALLTGGAVSGCLPVNRSCATA